MRIEISRVAVAAVLLLNIGCLRDDPNHCKNDPLGVAVVCDGTARYCDACASSEINRGCVAAMPSEACNYVDASANASTEAGTAATAGTAGSTGSGGPMESTSTGSGECSPNGAVDPACPEPTLYCVEGTCAPCSDAAATLCAGLDAATPVCGTQGTCVECEYGDDGTCEQSIVGKYCDPLGGCSGCFQHSQCGLAGCDLENNECLPESKVFFLAGGACTQAEDTGDGSVGMPFCSLAKAQAEIGDRATLRIRDLNTYADAAVDLSNGRVMAVLGDTPAGLPTIGRVETSTEARLYLGRVQLTGTANELVSCVGGSVVWASDSAITGNTTGLGADIINCTLRLERTVVSLNDDGGIVATGASLVDLRSAAVIANGGDFNMTVGIRIEGDSTMTASHSTILQNFGVTGGRDLTCSGGHTVTISNSIVMRSEDRSISGCSNITLTHTAVNDMAWVDDAASVVLVDYMPSYFVDPEGGDPHLTTSAPFADLGSWQRGDPALDLDGDPLDLRLGATNLVGCDQR